MKFKYLRKGRYYKRPCWDSGLTIHCPLGSDDVYYYRCGEKIDIVLHSSTIRDKDDFVSCDKFGRIKTIKKEEKEMTKVNKNYIGGDYQLVKVTYEIIAPNLGHTYIFKADIDLDLEEGNLVVVDSSNGYGICKVLNVFPDSFENAAESSKANAWVVDKVNTERHEKKIKATERKEWLLMKLEERKSQVTVNDMYALLAKSDKSAAKYLKELNSLGN